MTQADLIKADPIYRRRLVTGLLSLVAVYLVMYAVVGGDPLKTMTAAYIGDLNALYKTDPLAAKEKSRNVILGSVGVLSLFGASISGYLFWCGLRMWRAGQWPLPGAKVLQDTKITRGPSLRAKALVGIVGGAVTFAFVCYNCYRLVSWAVGARLI